MTKDSKDHRQGATNSLTFVWVISRRAKDYLVSLHRLLSTGGSDHTLNKLHPIFVRILLLLSEPE